MQNAYAIECNPSDKLKSNDSNCNGNELEKEQNCYLSNYWSSSEETSRAILALPKPVGHKTCYEVAINLARTAYSLTENSVEVGCLVNNQANGPVEGIAIVKEVAGVKQIIDKVYCFQKLKNIEFQKKYCVKYIERKSFRGVFEASQTSLGREISDKDCSTLLKKEFSKIVCEPPLNNVFEFKPIKQMIALNGNSLNFKVLDSFRCSSRFSEALKPLKFTKFKSIVDEELKGKKCDYKFNDDSKNFNINCNGQSVINISTYDRDGPSLLIERFNYGKCKKTSTERLQDAYKFFKKTDLDLFKKYILNNKSEKRRELFLKEEHRTLMLNDDTCFYRLAELYNVEKSANEKFYQSLMLANKKKIVIKDKVSRIGKSWNDKSCYLEYIFSKDNSYKGYSNPFTSLFQMDLNNEESCQFLFSKLNLEASFRSNVIPFAERSERQILLKFGEKELKRVMIPIDLETMKLKSNVVLLKKLSEIKGITCKESKFELTCVNKNGSNSFIIIGLNRFQPNSYDYLKIKFSEFVNGESALKEAKFWTNAIALYNVKDSELDVVFKKIYSPVSIENYIKEAEHLYLFDWASYKNVGMPLLNSLHISKRIMRK